MRGSKTAAPSDMAGSNRRQPARSARSTAARPSNYYARPTTYPYQPLAPLDQATNPNNPPGFFPAITHFTDGLSALPKEVMRHFTLIRETEGKAYLPDQAIGEALDSISKLPEPPKEPLNRHNQPYLGFSLNNSVNGSAPGSVVDGNVPTTQRSLSDLDDAPQMINEQLETRRACFSRLREHVRSMLNVLDEKNMVLTSANDTLARNLARLDGTLPHVENEISEEARLGSNTHWALPHMRELRKGNGASAATGSRREVQAANSLAAAAAAIHEGDIAATRSEARREALQAKRRHNDDSDFDSRPPPKRAPAGARSRKTQEAAEGADGKPHKRRRADKAGAHGMERLISGATNGRPSAASARERDGAADGPVRKKNKPVPASAVPRKRPTANSPSIASSPTRGTFTTTTNKDLPHVPGAARSGSARGRQNSALSSKSTGPDGPRRGPPSVASSVGVPNGPPVDVSGSNSISNATSQHAVDTRPGAKTTLTPVEGGIAIEQEGVHGALVVDGASASRALKREETEPTDAMDLPLAAHHSLGEPTSHGSKPGTPIEGVGATSEAAMATGMARSRSTRGYNGNGATARGGSANSPATRAADDAVGTAAPRRSQKKSAKAFAESIRSPPSSIQADASSTITSHPRAGNATAATDEYGSVVDEDEAGLSPGEDEEVSPDEPRYCICNGPSYGQMIACDNKACVREWFHVDCVAVTKVPGPKTKWYCDECKENMKAKDQLRKR